MSGHHLLTWLLIGLIAGALAGRVVGGGSRGCLTNIVVGLAGAIIGGALLDAIDPNHHWAADGVLDSILVAFIGAALLLAVLRLVGGRGGGPLGRRGGMRDLRRR